ADSVKCALHLLALVRSPRSVTVRSRTRKIQFECVVQLGSLLQGQFSLHEPWRAAGILPAEESMALPTRRRQHVAGRTATLRRSIFSMNTQNEGGPPHQLHSFVTPNEQ